MKNNLCSSAENIDFSKDTDKIISRVNAWVNNLTNGKISEILPQGSINQFTRMIIVNAIYFKGNWNKKFDESKTQRLPFYLEGKK